MYDILFSMRVLVSRLHGYSPFRLVFKCKPVLPYAIARSEESLLEPEFSDEDVQEMVEELERLWTRSIVQVRQKLASTDG